MNLNLVGIDEAVANRGGRLLDLGCGDGERTLRFARACGAAEAYGVEVTPEHAVLAEARGITVVSADLNAELPLDDGSFDIVVSNQVIEHLADTDAFVSEIARITKPGGLVVTSTENLASWHNISGLLVGWQPFSLTNVSETRLGLGNPLAVHRDEEAGLESWQHLRVFAYRGLRELHEAHGLHVTRMLGSGYYPLPARIGRLDPRHAAFLTVVAERPDRDRASRNRV